MLKFHLFGSEVVTFAIRHAVAKLSPLKFKSNPVLIIVWLLGVLSLLATILSLISGYINEPIWFTFGISLSIWLVLIFSNFIEAIAEYNKNKYSQDLLKVGSISKFKKVYGGVETEVTSIKIGDKIILKIGDLVPCDGVVIDGVALVDESTITGESAPVVRDTSESRNIVKSGSKIISDSLVVLVTSEINASSFSLIEEKVNLTERKLSVNDQSLSSLIFAYSLTYLILCISLYLISGKLGFRFSIIDFAALLICLIPTTIAGLLAPIGISAMARLMKKNILPYSQSAIESAGDIDIIVFDKTGTITEGKRNALSYKCFINDEARFLKALELSSIFDVTHEGKSIIELVNKINSPANIKGLDKKFNLKKYINIPFSAHTRTSGAVYGGNEYIKGSFDAIAKLCKGKPIPQAVMQYVQSIGEHGATPLLLMENNEIIGGVELADKIKPGIAPRLQRLKNMGHKLIMITGDNYFTAKYIANSIGIEDFICEADPDRKLAYVEELQALGKVVAFIGDGANDALSISTAEVGFVMSSAPEVSLEAANIIDLDNDPTKMIDLVEVGRETLMTRGCLTTFSFVNEIIKYLLIVPIMFSAVSPNFESFNYLNLHNSHTAILAVVIFNTLIIPIMMPVALLGVRYRPLRSMALVKSFFMVFGLGGAILPIIGIKILDAIITSLIAI